MKKEKVSLPLNPYIAGPAIRERKAFFGREDVFREVMKVLRHQHNNAIVLFGQRRIGKTSVLLQLESRLADDGEFTPIYFDLQDKAAKPLSELLYEIALIIAAKTGQATPNHADFDGAGNYFRQVFLPAVASTVGVGGLVLLFDEFDVLDNPQESQAGQALFPYLREWMAQVQQIKFVFVIGRRPQELSKETISTFKAAKNERVWLLEFDDAQALIRQSERNGSLDWADAAVKKVWTWTEGHPYLTQSLCEIIWYNAYETEPSATPQVKTADVDIAIDQTIKKSTGPLHWIWDGLPPAERVAMAAIAEAGDVLITPEKLGEIYNRSGVRYVMRELEQAPEKLASEEWGLLRSVDNGYRFVVPLLYRWVAAQNPLRQVIERELDRLDPFADNLYKTGRGFYLRGQPAEAESQLRQALRINFNHLQAMLLLGRILLEGGRFAESVAILEDAHKRSKEAARAPLINALLALADTQSEAEQLTTCERVLQIDPNQPIALEKRQAIWMARGDAALQKEDFPAAIAAFEKINALARIEQAIQLRRKRESERLLEEAAKYHEKGNFDDEIAIINRLLKEYSDQGDFTYLLEMAQTQANLAQRYDEALAALNVGNTDTAIRVLVGVLSKQYDYKDARLLLIFAIDGMESGIARLRQLERAMREPAKADKLPAGVSPKPTLPSLQTKIAMVAEELKQNITARIKRGMSPKLPPTPASNKSQTEPVITTAKPPQPLSALLQKLSGYLNALWKKLQTSEEFKKLFEHPASWLASLLIWLPLLVWAAWFGLSSQLQFLPDSKLGQAIIFFLGLLLTAWFGHLGKIPKREVPFTIQGRKIPEWGMMALLLFAVILLASILAKGMPPLLIVVLLGVTMAIVVSWKRAGSVAVLIACGVAASVATGVRNINPEDKPFVELPFSNGRNAPEDTLDRSRNDPPPLATSKVPPNVLVLADNLENALFADRNNEVAQIANILADSASARKCRTSLNARFGSDFYAKAVQFFDAGNEPAGANLAGLLGKLQDFDALSPIYAKFSSIGDKGKRYCAAVLKGFSNYYGKERCEIITWLALQRYWKKSDEVIAALNEAFSAFKLPAVSPNTVTLTTRLQTALAIRNYTDAADYALALYGDRNLNYALASNESNRKIFDDGDFYDNALKVIRAGNPCQSRGLALFLSKLQTNKLRAKTCNDKLWDQSDTEEKRLYLFVLGGFTAKTEQRNRIIEWLQERQNKESGDILVAMRQTLAKIQ